MKKLIIALVILVSLYRLWWLLNDRLLGIEMNHEDFSRWIHSDLQGIHDHLDKCSVIGFQVNG